MGTGLSLPAYPTQCEVTGVDLAPEMLERARQKAVENGWRHFRFMEMDALDLKFPDNSFDFVTSFHVVTVVPDPVRMMREIYRVCKPGGTVVIINHFRTTKPLLGPLIGALDPVTRLLGWHASLRLSDAFADVPLQIEKRFKTSPTSLFTSRPVCGYRLCSQSGWIQRDTCADTRRFVPVLPPRPRLEMTLAV
jgi:phosphatidylethanolamine/phosphatidyl-N-methylethanolamine N-methyltransferase